MVAKKPPKSNTPPALRSFRLKGAGGAIFFPSGVSSVPSASLLGCKRVRIQEIQRQRKVGRHD